MYSNSCGIVCVAKRQNSKEAPCGKEKEQTKTITEITRQKPTPPQIRLAAYCRVSSDSSDQLHSFAAQIKYYSEYCKRHPEYKFVDIYADEGITGTSMEKRDDFRRMLRDCKKGLIDRIIVKSMSRFARNTEEMLTALRALEQMEVSVYFEEQGLDTKSMNSEMFATFPGMVAQQESVSISQNMRWSYKKRMKSGEFNCCAPAYGFDLINGKLVINETEAAVIRRIFNLYLEGIGMQANREYLLGALIRQLEELQYRTTGSQQRIKEIDREIADLTAQNLVLSRLHGKGVLNAVDYTAQSDVLENRITKLRIERREKNTDSDENEMLDELKMLNDILKEVEIGIDFDAKLFEQTVDNITVESNELLTFHLAGGISLPEKIREKGRCYQA